MIPGPVLAYAREANDGPSPSIHGCQSLTRYGFSSSKLGKSLWMSVSTAWSFAVWSVTLLRTFSPTAIRPTSPHEYRDDAAPLRHARIARRLIRRRTALDRSRYGIVTRTAPSTTSTG